MARIPFASGLVLALSLCACGLAPPGLVPVDMVAEQQRLQQTYPEATGFAFLDPINSGLLLNLDGSGTYIRNPGSSTTDQGLVLLPLEYVPVTITGIAAEAVCTSLGCLSLSRSPEGALFCEVRWDNGNQWPVHPCNLLPIPPGFDVTTIRRQAQ